MYEFQTKGPVMVSVKIRGGVATVTAEERDSAVVEVEPYDGSDASRQQAESTRVEMQGDTLVVHAPEPAGWIWRRGSIRVTARVPLDSGLDIHSASADVVLQGRWREGSITSASGDVRVESVTGDLRVNTASGDAHIAGVGGDLRVNSASGDVEIGTLGGDGTLHSASGDLRIYDTGGSVQARTASGDIDLLRARRGEVRATTASGDVTVSVLPGTAVYMDVRTLSGSTHSDLDVGDKPLAGKGEMLSVRVQTASGDIAVVRAPVGDPVSHT
jgi:DUF4097 and DUF4098 domain-containing protein YvlB